MIESFESVQRWMEERPRSAQVAVLSSCTDSKGLRRARAFELYRGQHHVRLMQGVRQRVEQGGHVHVNIVSAGYGIIPANKEIDPYDRTFSGQSREQLRARATELGIPESARRWWLKAYDVKIVALGDDYLRACSFDYLLPVGGPTIMLCSEDTATRIPDVPGLVVVMAGTQAARRYSCGVIGLKGELASRLLRAQAEVAVTSVQEASP